MRVLVPFDSVDPLLRSCPEGMSELSGTDMTHTAPTTRVKSRQTTQTPHRRGMAVHNGTEE